MQQLEPRVPLLQVDVRSTLTFCSWRKAHDDYLYCSHFPVLRASLASYPWTSVSVGCPDPKRRIHA